MDVLNKTFRIIERNFSTLRTQPGARYEYLIPDTGKILLAQGGALPANAAAAAQATSPALGKAFLDAIAILPYHSSLLEMGVRTTVFMRIASALGYMAIAGNEGSIFLYAPSVELQRDMEANFSELSDLFACTFGDAARGQLRRISLDDWESVTNKHLAQAKDYYLALHGDWIRNFTENLGDELSKDSFATFMRQRIFTKVCHNSPTCYPVTPPVQSATWRKEREQMQHNFPTLKGCSESLLHDFIYKHTFVYDQYSIAGTVEAQPGHTVIDAGAFIGDTSCYFSRKVGGGGKVYAFEATPDSARIARENMQINGCDNVEVVPLALSNQKTKLYLNENSDAASANIFSGTKDGCNQITVEALPLDDFVTERGIRVDFIKADIEGAEMDMLNGAAQTIARDAPICALSLYHKEDDFWIIPDFLRAQVKDYRFWFRCEAEPVLFARRG